MTRWVNSPSVDKDRTQVILSEDGEESVKMMVRFMTVATAHRRDAKFHHMLKRLFGWIGRQQNQRHYQLRASRLDDLCIINDVRI